MHLDIVAGTQAGAQTAVSLAVESRFMQNYRLASAANAGSEVATVANAQGGVELFTVGTDGKVWNFYPDPSSDTGYSQVDTGLSGSGIAVEQDGAGRIVVFAIQGQSLAYVTEVNAPGARWSASALCQVPLPSGATAIQRLLARQVAGQLYIAALTGSSGPSPGTLYHLAYAAWPASGPAPLQLQRTNLAINTLNCVWTGSSASTAAFTVVDTVILDFNIQTQQTTRRVMAGTFNTIDVDSAVDAAGNSALLAILEDGNAYCLTDGGQGTPLNWAQLSVNRSFKQIRTEADSGGQVHALLLDANNRVYHLQPSSTVPSGYLEPASILASTVQLGLTRRDGGGLDLFAVGAAHSSITHLYLQEDSGNWQSETLEIQASGAMEDYASFSSDVLFSDAAGAPLADTAVNVWASSKARLLINGHVYFVTSKRPARVTTNASGMVAIAQETGKLSVPQVLVAVPGLMTAGDSIAIEQNANTNASLAAMSGDALMAAKDLQGQPLLNGNYRNQQTADSVAAAVAQCAGIASARAWRGLPQPYLNPRRANVGARHFSGDAAELRRIARSQVQTAHWQIAFSAGNARYRALDAQEAAVLLAEKRASLPKVAGFFDWLEDIGDFVAGVAAGIVSVVDTVLTTVADGIQAAITFVVDGVTYLFEAVVDAIEQALDLAQMVFSQVRIFFEQLYEWLAMIFDWGDILRTHEALAYTLNQGLSFLGLAAGAIQRGMDQGFANFQAQLHAMFQNAIQSIAGQSSIGAYEKGNAQDSPVISASNANNIVLNNLVDNAGASTCTTSALTRLRAELGDPVSDIIAQLTSFADMGMATQAFDDAIGYFNNLGGSPDQIFSQLLAGLMSLVEGVLQAVISGVQAVLDALFSLVQSVLSVFQAVLNEEWDIPFVSQLYALITKGSKLTTVDLMALVIAVPVTILYKVMYSVAPFPNSASVDAFKGTFTAATMLNATGLGAPQTADANDIQTRTDAGLAESAVPATLLNAGACISGAVYSILNGVLDAFPPVPGTKPPSVMTRGAFVAEALAQFCSFPWFYSSGGVDCTTTEGRGRWLWLYTCCGVVMDFVFIYKEDTMPENWEDKGVYLGFAYGAGHLALAISASVGQDSLGQAACILPTIQELCKPLRLTRVVTATKGVSLPVLGAIDGLFGIASTITGFAATQRNIKPGTEDTGRDVMLLLFPASLQHDSLAA